jgi:HEAT repeat protein
MIALLLIASMAAAQQPRVINGRLQPAASAGSLESMFQRLVAAQTEPAWIGYTVAALKDRQICCSGDTWMSDGVVITNGRLASCTLEPTDRAVQRNTGDVQVRNPVRLEGPETFTVLYRAENHAVERIRILSSDCDLDAGGRTIHWIENVSGSDSVKLLATFVSKTEQRTDKLTDGALAAIAMHRDEAADSTLERFGSGDSPVFVRKKVAFWLGNARGHRGFETVRRMARTDPSDDVRKSAMFALSQSPDDQAVAELIRFARKDKSPRVRGEAIFWLGQKAGRKAEAQITASIENDPDTDVKKRAVFALSQLPKDEGVPLLIQVAKTNQNPAVRKQAMFWLGQSRDPRALDFFAEVLGR